MFKINIRSVTLCINNESIFSSDIEKENKKFFKVANDIFTNSKINVRTNRISISPFNTTDSLNLPYIKEVANTISEISKKSNVRWFCMPFSTFGSGDLRLLNQSIIEIIKRHSSAFVNIIVAENNKINFNGIKYASRLIGEVSKLSSSGYHNFRVGVSCNMNPNGPFFPFSYQKGKTGFSIALELTQLFIQIINNLESNDLKDIRKEIIKILVPLLIDINKLCKNIEKKTSIKYYGIDSSLAPLPEDNHSVAYLIEKLGVENYGGNGTLFLTSYLTNIIKTIVKESNIINTGFNGVMFSHLEDPVMGKRNNIKNFSIDSLIAYSSVCGCGIDMVPIPGDSFEEEISSLI